MERRIELQMQAQPDDAACGPTCLHAVYRYYGDSISLQAVVEQVKPLETGGTLAVMLACHALQRGYRATIYTYNLQLFDPSWFSAPGVDVPQRLREQMRCKAEPKVQLPSREYLEFFALGGELRFQELSPTLIRRYLNDGHPILTGLSATYLYGCPRELGNEYDDVRGEPCGHFVVLCGYDQETRQVLVADPLRDNPRFTGPNYAVSSYRLIGAILLGILTHDANLLIIEPGRDG